MARRLRINYPGAFYHVTSRDNERKDIFKSRRDREKFLDGRSGHLFQGRYKAMLVDIDEYAKELSRYIHLNPVRAKMVKTPEEYEW
ncbi:MAG: hypothetical protein MUO43_12305 [Desulfobacterales bacterium]|nr:hypothetical protein [Desulfobacterales bacterium]